MSTISSNKVYNTVILVLYGALTATLILGVRGVMIEQLRPLNQAITEINQRDLIAIRRAGIAAYKKFEGLEGQALFDKLESSTQNTGAALTALEIPEIYDELYLYNRPLTIALTEYFGLS